MATCPTCRVIYGDDQRLCPADGENLLPDAAFSAADPDLKSGDQVGEYQIERKIGEGGFGVVFAAVQPLIGKQVAIKVLNRQYSANPQMVSRFIAEARAVNQIRHRNIIDIFSFGQLPDGRHYYVMELLNGTTLDRYIDERGRLSLPEAVPILRALARALDAAHAKGIAHRDLKPENVFISEDDDGSPFPKLLDFGIAKLLASDAQLQHKTRTGAPIGTPYFMSPEQCRGRDVDHRTDLYSFGIMVYQMLTGQLPFTGQDYMEILLKQISETPPPPSELADLPLEVDTKVMWFLQKDPAARPPSLVVGVRELEDAAQQAGIAVPLSPTGVYGAQPTPTPGRMASVPTPTPNRITPVGKIPTGQLRDLGHAATMAGEGVTPGYAAAEASEPIARKSRTGLVVGLILTMGVGGAAAFFFYQRSQEQESRAAAPPPAASPGPAPAPAPTPPPPTEPPSPEPVAQAAATPAVERPVPPEAPAKVALDVQGVPPGTEVIGPDGTILGKAPGKIDVARGEAPLKLEFRARGYKPETAQVTPKADGVLTVVLEKKASRPRASKPEGDEEKKKPGKDDIEDAF